MNESEEEKIKKVIKRFEKLPEPFRGMLLKNLETLLQAINIRRP